MNFSMLTSNVLIKRTELSALRREVVDLQSEVTNLRALMIAKETSWEKSRKEEDALHRSSRKEEDALHRSLAQTIDELERKASEARTAQQVEVNRLTSIIDSLIDVAMVRPANVLFDSRRMRASITLADADKDYSFLLVTMLMLHAPTIVIDVDGRRYRAIPLVTPDELAKNFRYGAALSFTHVVTDPACIVSVSSRNDKRLLATFVPDQKPEPLRSVPKSKSRVKPRP